MNFEIIDGIISVCRDKMRTDKGMNTDAQRLPQLLWMLFLKCFDDFELQKEVLGEHKPIIEKPYRWRDWTDDEEGDRGEELIKFVNNKLFKYLINLQGEGSGDQRDIIADIFHEQKNFMTDGYLMKDVIQQINKFDFTSSKQFHLIGSVYEKMLLSMRDNSPDTFGEFYTPRPIIKFIVEAINPLLKKRETILDPACGTAGFLIESFKFLEDKVKGTTDNDFLQTSCLTGIEARSDPFLFGLMNMMLHGITSPKLFHANTLGVKINDIHDDQQVEIIMTNPPFSGEEVDSIKRNFKVGFQTKDTAVGFLQHCMARLKDGGRCAIILPDGEPLVATGVPQRVREKLINECNLHTIIKLPESVFRPYASIPTNILFFEKTKPSEEIWFYEVTTPKHLKAFSKTNPLQNEYLDDLRKWWKNKKIGKYSWKVNVNDLKNFKLEIRNPNASDVFSSLGPHNLLEQLIQNEKKRISILENVLKLFGNQKTKKNSKNIKNIFDSDEKRGPIIRKIFNSINGMLMQKFIPTEIPSHWISKKLIEVAHVTQGSTPSRSNPNFWENGTIPWIKSGEIRNNRISESEEKITKSGLKTSRLAKKGSILLGMTGQGYTRGRSSILDIDAATNQSCAQIFVYEKKLLNEFLWYFFQSRYWHIRSIRQGMGQPGINISTIKELDVAYPPTIDEQKEIIKKIKHELPKLDDLKNIKL